MKNWLLVHAFFILGLILCIIAGISTALKHAPGFEQYTYILTFTDWFPFLFGCALVFWSVPGKILGPLKSFFIGILFWLLPFIITSNIVGWNH